jgi:hypothetical protein
MFNSRSEFQLKAEVRCDLILAIVLDLFRADCVGDVASHSWCFRR